MEFEIRKIVIPDSEEDMRSTSSPVSDYEEDELFMWEWLEFLTEETENCLGLAARQIGINASAFYLHADDTGPIRFRNPEIMNYSQEKRVYKQEGCMSFPGKFIDTERYVWVTVKDDINGTRTYTGRLAVCIQHEIDHLNGVLFFDRQAHSTYIRGGDKIKRNDPCPCGSLKKYKKCCGKGE